LAEHWIAEFRDGIAGTGVRPGFIKISVNRGSLTEISKKLIRAAALTHLETGLTIMSHTGPGVPAMEQIEIVKGMGVAPSAFIWTHAQAETDQTVLVRAARERVWVSLDDINDDKIAFYVDVLRYLKRERCLDRILLSHDAGWYNPGQENGGLFRGFATLISKLLPALRSHGFGEDEIQALISDNPAAAFEIRVRRFDKETHARTD
jgi:phosphotriesterase-related protein